MILLEGKMLKKKQQVNIASLTKGVYFIKLATGETARFVK
jgi:hypothetical protein